MTDKPLVVFISSTSQDLKAFLIAVHQAVLQLEMVPIDAYELQTPDTDIDLHKQKVNEADVFIGIYAYCYGPIPLDVPDKDAALEGKSITEMEYYWAKEKGIERLIFIVDPEAKLQPDDPILVYADTLDSQNMSDEDRLRTAQKAEKLKVFKAALVKDHHEKFSSIDEFTDQAAKALTHWQQHRNHSDFAIPPWIIMLILLVFALIINLDIAWRIFRAGPDLGMLISTMVMAIASLVPVAAYSLKFIKFSPPNSFRRWLPVAVLFIVLLVLAGVRQPMLDALAQTQFQLALSNADANSARPALSHASVLGMDVKAALRQALSDALDNPVSESFDQRVKLLADLVHMENAADADLINQIQSQLSNALNRQSLNLAVRTANALITVSPDDAAAAAGVYNDRAVEALQARAWSSARVYLEVVKVIDKELPGLRTEEQRSLTAYNNGFLVEHDDSNTENLIDAENAYREAIALNQDNLEARQAVIALLIEKDALDEAIEMAVEGQNRSSASCDFAPLSDSERTENCFRLIVLEGVARIENGESPTDVLPLAENALRIALNTSIGYTADAYYLYSITKPDTSREMLCAIVSHQNLALERHVDMAQYANNLLADKQEDCRPSLEPITLDS